MNKDNSKVPIAVLSCFLIAFILQGMLKASGVLIFEKALDWEIFKIIDNNLFLNITFYSMLSFCAVYCLSCSFMLNYTNKTWWHYILMFLSSFGFTALRKILILTTLHHLLIDVFIYIVVPFVIQITTTPEYKMIKNDLFGVITTLCLNIFLYLAYLGLCYWSSVLNSLIIMNPTWLSSSSNFLIQTEVYLGLIIFMLSSNSLVKYIKGR